LHPGSHPQELADVAQGFSPHRNDLAWLGANQFESFTAMADANAALGPVVDIQAAKERGLACTRAAVQHQAFTGADLETQAFEHLDFNAMLLMQNEGLLQVAHFQQRVHGVASWRYEVSHGCNTEETSNCV